MDLPVEGSREGADGDTDDTAGADAVVDADVDEGVLDPRLVAMREDNPFLLHPLSDLSPEILALARGPELGEPRRSIATVTDGEVDGIPIRTYAPVDRPAGLVVYAHGGGWMIGSIGIIDEVARELAHAGGVTVVSVGYRLAPEHPYPAGLDDLEAVTRWAVADLGRFSLDASSVRSSNQSSVASSNQSSVGPSSHSSVGPSNQSSGRSSGRSSGSSSDASSSGPPSGRSSDASAGRSAGGSPVPVVVAGESAGGNLSAALTLRLRQAGDIRLAGQVLIYPSTGGPRAFPSKDEFDGLVLDRQVKDTFWQAYTAGRDLADDPFVVPLAAEDLRDLPPALVLLGGCDVLRDEGRAYAGRLRHDGVAVDEICYPGQPHGFVNMGFPAAADAFADVGTWLRRLLGS